MIPFALKRRLYYAYQEGMMRMFGCIFCQIAAHEKPATVYFEDDSCLAIQDVHPRTPVHFLVIPRRHIASLNEIAAEDEQLLGHLVSVAARVAKDKGIDGSGFRTVINTNAEGGQTVFHLHVHVMGGRPMTWPPG
jgi:histidine triad (HIT) family protein